MVRSSIPRAWRFRWCSEKKLRNYHRGHRGWSTEITEVMETGERYATDSQTCRSVVDSCLRGGFGCAVVSGGAADAAELCGTVREERSDDPDAGRREAAYGDLFAEECGRGAADLDESNALRNFGGRQRR